MFKEDSLTERVNPWLVKSIENLMPLSLSDTFTFACKEWRFTGEVIDHLTATEQCELCEHDELRYHYLIENNHNANKLWVGSSCILRFGEIVVLDENNQEIRVKEDREKALEKALKAKQIDMTLEPLRKLWRVATQHRGWVLSMANEIKDGKALPPENLKSLFQLMHTHAISFKAEDYSVNLRQEFFQFQLLYMERDMQKLIWLCMSKQQKDKFRDRLKI
ncbi:hypothetical protein ACI1G1_003401 [Vibrio cholerae]|nr:hypothetical protein CGT94_15240 [Vibrio metoecus]